MTRNRTLLVSVALLALLAPACRPKKPVTPAPTPAPPPAAAPAPTPAPAPPAEPADPLAGDLEAVNRYVAEQGLLGDIYFDFDRAELRTDALTRLERNANFLREHPQFTVKIEGHCDERGTNEYNLALGERRASAARGRLIALGLGGDRFTSLTYGEERPVCSTSEESCWSKNRRAHFVISGRR